MLDEQLGLVGVDVDHADEDAVAPGHEVDDRLQDLVERRLDGLTELVAALPPSSALSGRGVAKMKP